MQFTYDPGLVALSIVIAILGSFTGLVMTAGLQNVRGREFVLRTALGGLGVGGGIWAMHFIAMLAVVLPIPLSYDLAETVISALLAVIFTSLAFAIVSHKKFGKHSLVISALFLGVGIGGMHYLGMNAVRGNCVVEYSILGVVISLVIAIQASAVALWFAFRQRRVLDTLLGSVALGLAIASMHYSAMEGTRFLPAQNMADFVGGVSEAHLAFAIGLVMYSVCGLCIFVFALLTFNKRSRRPQLGARLN